MKKKQLLSLPPIEATEEMWALSLEEKEMEETTWRGIEKWSIRKYHWFLLAAREGEILKVALFENEQLRSGTRTPKYEIFMSKKEQRYTTLGRDAGKWYTAMIQNLPYEWGRYEKDEWIPEEDRNIITEFLGCGRQGRIREEIRKWQECCPAD